jgi:oligosaccharide 4-alpha-D-glucosyltransferase
MKKKFSFLCLIIVALYSCQQKNFNDEQFQFTRKNGVITITNQEITYLIEPYRADMVKTVFIPGNDSLSEENPYFVVLEKDKDINFSVEEFQDKLLVKTTELIVEITKLPFVVNYYDIHNKLLLKSSRMPSDSSGYKTMYFNSPANEQYYGMGQKSIPVNRRGYAFITRNFHVGGYSKEYATMQVNIPYIYSSGNYGMFFDNTYTGHFDLAKSDPQEWSYRADGGNYTFYFTAGKDLQALQNNYYDLTGYPTIPPKWTLGLLQSKCGYVDENEVFDVIEKFRKHHLPLDAIILDAFWFGGYGEDYPQLMGNFTWLKDHFPDPEAYMSHLKDQGIKTITINEPQINTNSENHAMLLEKDLLMKVNGEPYIQNSFWAGSASLLDLTHPEAQDWLWKKQKANVELGLDGFWVDLTEPDVSTPEGEFYAGEEPKIHNIYSLLFAKTLWDGFQKDYPDRRLFNITRAGTAGMHRMGAVHWSGDAAKTFSALKYQIPMLIGCSMSGMPHYSSDIGGFTNAWDTISVPWTEYKGGKGVTTPELYTRWFQFGVFSPMLRPHSGEDQSCEPFAFNEQTLDITSKYLNLRYKLIPYLYSYAYKTATTGEQLIKPLFMCFDDEKAKNRNFEYMFGDMLVAPVFESGQTEREVYLPKLKNDRKWIDFWDNTEYESGKTHTVKAPLSKIPVFVKGGSIIVSGKKKKYVGEKPDDTLYVDLYPGGGGEFLLYEDDGETKAYENGAYKTTKISSTRHNKKLTIVFEPSNGKYQGMVDSRIWMMRMNQISEVGKVILNGKQIEYKEDNKKKLVEFSTLQSINDTVEVEVFY